MILGLLALLNSACAAPLGALSQPNAKHPSKHDVLRPIEWGDLNFVATTDTHGWLAGHLLEGQFSGDWGDFVSFGERLHAIADERGVDVVLVDCGDRHDGNGLSDASKHDARLSLPIFCEQSYDVVTVGNHELYRGAASLQEYDQIRKHFGERYVVSNVEVAIGKTWVPMGAKYRVFTTKNQRRRVLAFGFLFNFEGNDKDATRVTRVEDEIRKPWFQRVLREELPHVDYVLLVGHIPLRGFPEFEHLLAAVRAARPDVPVSMFGGHSHVRDFRQYDDRAVALQAGRYVETIGWQSTNLTTLEFARAYIDFNQRTMAFHAGVDQPEFLTEHGRRVSQQIKRARRKLALDEYRADVPQNYYTDRAEFPSARSVYSLLQERVLPLLTSPRTLEGKTRYILLNTGAVRFDLFKGPYTKDTGYILSPFKNEWFYIDDVPRSVADKVLPIINGFDRVLAAKSRLAGAAARGGAAVMEVARSRTAELELELELEGGAPRFEHGGELEQQSLGSRPSYGYQTEDDWGHGGDDTVHTPWRFHPIPNAFQAVVEPAAAASSDKGAGDRVALIFHDFVASFVHTALVELGQEELYRPEFHGGEEVIDLLPKYFNSLKSST